MVLKRKCREGMNRGGLVWCEEKTMISFFCSEAIMLNTSRGAQVLNNSFFWYPRPISDYVVVRS